MNKNRLGCFSFTAIIAFVLTLLVAGIFVVTSGSAMFSPGKLNQHGGEMLGGVTSHSAIGSDCTACHVAPWATESMQDRCLRCHTEVKLEVTDETTLHGALLMNNPQLTCRDCHPDHRGPDAPLTELVPASFPHELVGFSLASHQRKTDGQSFVCSDCHTQSITVIEQSACRDCHQNINASFMQTHTSAYGENCIDCHDGLETYGANFNHAQTGFTLIGKHMDADCAGCHQNARSLADFGNAPEDCVGCHQKDDAHQGRYGTNCAICHTPTNWETTTFDHNLSNFPLEGKHQDVVCEDCHTSNNLQDTPSDCFSCHEKDDAHIGRFGQDCAACHTPQNWNDTHFTHDVVTATTACITCHQLDDHHNGQYGTDCAACHSTDAWKPASFDHNLSNFPLTGAHVNTACESCHSTGSFSGLSSQCVTCHADPVFHQGAVGTNCASCHNTSNWIPADYNLSHPAVADEGGRGIRHGGASCRTCHPSTVYQYTCLSCHSDNFGGEGRGGDD